MISLGLTIAPLVFLRAALAHPLLGRSGVGQQEFTWLPTLKSVKNLGNGSDNRVNRDSCGTTRIFDCVLTYACHFKFVW